MPIIDTPAEGFPLPTLAPPTRTLRDVAARLTRGSKARAVQRAAADYQIPDEQVDQIIAESLRRDGTLHDVGDVMRERRQAWASAWPADEVTQGLEDGLAWEPPTRPAFTSLVERVTREARDAAEVTLRNAFDAGRAYERGATLRRNVSAKSLGSRRVQAQGIAADYLRDDPERGHIHAAMVLAGFTGADPASVTA